MSFIFERFDTLDIPLLNGVQEIGTGESASPTFQLASGGVYDPLGDEQAPRGETPIAIRGSIVSSDPAVMQSTMRAWREKRGRRGKLYRRWDGDGKIEWVYARLRNLPIERGVTNWNNQEIELQFVMQSPHWYGSHHGGGWHLDDGYYLDDGYTLDESDSYSIPSGIHNTVISNGGTATLTNVRLVFTNGAGAPAITALTIKIGPDYDNDGTADYFETNVQYIGTIPADGVLIIDSGAKRVTLNGVGDYANFVISGLQTIDAWLRFLPEVNAVISTNMTGGSGVTMVADFWGGHE